MISSAVYTEMGRKCYENALNRECISKVMRIYISSANISIADVLYRIHRRMSFIQCLH